MMNEKMKMFKRVIFDTIWLKYYNNVYYDDVVKLVDNITDFFYMVQQLDTPIMNISYNKDNSVSIIVKNSAIVENTEFKMDYRIHLYSNHITIYKCDIIEINGIISHLVEKSSNKTLKEIINQ